LNLASSSNEETIFESQGTEEWIIPWSLPDENPIEYLKKITITEWEKEWIPDSERRKDLIYDFKRLKGSPTKEQIESGEAVLLHRAGSKYVHKEEREHSSKHWSFCRVFNCEYHPAY
jgi:hypothetical protein